MIPLIRMATWNSVPVTQSLNKEQQDKIVKDTMVGGATLTALIGTSAWYAPGAAAAALVESIVRDEKKLFTCCVSLNGEYKQNDICLGVPVIIGKNGWEQIIDFQLNDAEQTAFDKSAAAVRSMNDVLKTL
jgi:malate dehydrogenase